MEESVSRDGTGSASLGDGCGGPHQGVDMTAGAFDQTWSIPVGMPVDDRAGQRVGKVCGFDQTSLLIQRGLILRHVLSVAFQDIDRVEDGRVILRITKDQAMHR